MDYDYFKELIGEKFTIILDTNVYLELYRLSTDSSKNILSLLARIEDRIIVPYQVLKEFSSNSKEVKQAQFNKYKNIEKELGQDIGNLLNNLKKRFYRYKRYNFPNIRELETQYESKISEMKVSAKDYLDLIGSEIRKNKEYLLKDSTKAFLDDLKEKGRVLKEFDIVHILEVLKEGELRYRYNIPPGYKDESQKEGIDKFGDLIIWKELLIFARENKQNIFFITLDNKEDWWDSDKSSARKELIQEFRRYNNENEIAFLSLSDFYSLATRYYNMTSFITELELKAQEYIEKTLIPRFDKIIIAAIDGYAYHQAEYSMMTDYVYNDIDVWDNHYDLVDYYLEHYNNEIIYSFRLKGYIEATLSREVEEIDFTIGTASIEISIEAQVTFKFDEDKLQLEGEGEFDITSITEENASFLDEEDRYNDVLIEKEEMRSIAEADMMDALEDYYKH